jgi:very-short-patch-repair endonuclease
MGALLRAPRRDGRKASAADRNSFSQKIVDFVVQDRLSGSVVALVEVDDSSHVARRDRERDAMTQRAGYTTIRIPARAKPALPDVRLALAPLLQSRTSISAAEDRQAGDA